MDNKNLEITDIRIGDMLQYKAEPAKLKVVGIFDGGQIYVHADNNEDEVWQVEIEDLKRAG